MEDISPEVIILKLEISFTTHRILYLQLSALLKLSFVNYKRDSDHSFPKQSSIPHLKRHFFLQHWSCLLSKTKVADKAYQFYKLFVVKDVSLSFQISVAVHIKDSKTFVQTVFSLLDRVFRGQRKDALLQKVGKEEHCETYIFRFINIANIKN